MDNSKRRILIVMMAVLTLFSMVFAFGCNEGTKPTVSGNTTIIENPSKKVTEYTSKEQLYVLAGKLQSAKAYRSDIEGKTVSDFPKYTQNIKDVHIKNGDEYFVQTNSTSLLVNIGNQAYFNGDKVVVRSALNVNDNTWSDDMNVIALKDYTDNTGVIPYGFTNYILNDNTILSATTKEVNGKFEVTCSVDPVKATSCYALQMMAYGGLKKAPVFSECNFIVTFDSDFNVEKIVSSDRYSINKGILNLTCSSTLTETFKAFSDKETIPDASLFRNKIGDDVTDMDDMKDLEGSELLFNTMLEMDTKNGVKIGGMVSLEMAGKKMTIPLDAWMTFDFDNYGENGLNSVFTGKVYTNISGMEVNIYYVGDNYLYVNLGKTKYKYLLAVNSGEDIPLEEIFNSLLVTESERKGDYRYFTINQSEDTLNAINSAIEKFTSKLPDNIGAIKNFKIKNITTDISLKKLDKMNATISDVALNMNTGLINVTGNLMLAEKQEALPTPVELAIYKEADWKNLENNALYIKNVINGFNAHNWATGTSFNIFAGLHSDENTAAALNYNFPVEVQNSADNGLRAYMNFVFGNLMGIGNELYFSDGELNYTDYIKENDLIYPSETGTINLGDKMNEMLPKLVGMMLKSDFNAVTDALADIALNSTIKETTLDSGIVRKELFMPKSVTTAVSIAYQELWNKILKMDLGPAGALLPFIVPLFQFPLDDVIIRAEYTGDKISYFGIRLTNYETSTAGGGMDLSFVVALTTFNEMAEGEMDQRFDIIEKGIKGTADSMNVRNDIKKLLSEGLNYIGDSMGERIEAIENAYAELDIYAQKTIKEYKNFLKLKDEFIKLRKGAVDFVALMPELRAVAGGTAEEIDSVLQSKLNPAYAKLDSRQVEYISFYIIDEYMAIRNNNEKTYNVTNLVAEIEKLNTATYPTFGELDSAIKAVKKAYSGLLEENKALVTNYDKVQIAEKECRKLELNEFNNSVKELTDNINALDASKTYDEISALRNEYNKYIREYNKLTADEKAVITNIDGLKNAEAKLYEVIGERFVNCYNVLGDNAEIVAGAECYNKIKDAQKMTWLMNNDQKTTYKDKIATVNGYATTHKEVEAKALDNVISTLGEVSFTEEFHNKLVEVRNAVKTFPSEYYSALKNSKDLINKEIEFVKLSLGNLTADTVTKADSAVVMKAREVYNEAINAYTIRQLDNGVTNGLKDFNTVLKAVEEVLKTL